MAKIGSNCLADATAAIPNDVVPGDDCVISDGVTVTTAIGPGAVVAVLAAQAIQSYPGRKGKLSLAN